MWLRKSIPVQAGLGGGSADAAAALTAVRRLLDVDIDAERLAALAAGVGSDVPFCLTGGAAWLRGRGELVEPVQLAGPLVLALALPRSSSRRPTSTPPGTSSAARSPNGGCRRPRPYAPLAQELSNDLELAAEHVEPRLADFRADLEAAADTPAILAGSGAAYAVLLDTDSPSEATALARRISRRLKVPVVGTRAVTHGVRLSA